MIYWFKFVTSLSANIGRSPGGKLCICKQQRKKTGEKADAFADFENKG